MASITDFARIVVRSGSALRRVYYRPSLDGDYVARTSGVYGTTPYSDPLVVISPTPTPGSHDPVVPAVPSSVGTLDYLVFVTDDGRAILTADRAVIRVEA